MRLKLIENDKKDIEFFESWISAVNFFFKKSVEKGIITDKTTKEEIKRIMFKDIEKNIKVKDCGNNKKLYYIDLANFSSLKR